MTDSDLMALANQHGMEQAIARDDDGGLANPAGLANELYQAGLITEAEWLGVRDKNSLNRAIARDYAEYLKRGPAPGVHPNYDGLD